MVNHQQAQAINQTNNVNIQQLQQSAQVFVEPGLQGNTGQVGYEPPEQGAPVSQVEEQHAQAEQKRQPLPVSVQVTG